MPAAAPGRRSGDRVRGVRHHRLLVVPARATGPIGLPTVVRMLADTGAALTCLSPQAAADVELDLARPLGYVRLSGIGNVTATVVLLDSLQVGALVAHRLRVAVLDLPTFLQVDGLLGVDFCDALGIRRVTLELDTATLVLR